ARCGKRRRYIVRCGNPKSVTFTEVEDAEFRLTEPRRIHQHRLEYRLQFAGRARNDLQHLGRCGLLLQCLGEALPRLVEFALVCFKLPFQVTARLAYLTNGRGRLRSGRTTLATLRSAFRAFARRGHPKPPPAEDQPFTLEKIAPKPQRV